MDIIDWTNLFDRKILINKTQNIINRILHDIYQKKYKIFKDNKFTEYEIY